jgi:oligoribonuclease NrnB/cAMP/cGMP phosphodiesterase (DHH superfamily)
MNYQRYNYQPPTLEEKIYFERQIKEKNTKLKLFDHEWTSAVYSLV